MTVQHDTPPRILPTWFLLAVAIAALVVASVALTATLFQAAAGWWGPMGGPGMMGRLYGSQATRATGSTLQPGQAGFLAGTTAQPRVIHLWAGPGYAFSPSTITVARGETVTFEVTVMGPTSHEFMVGPADAVAGDVAGTPEIDGLGMMQTRSLTYTFDGSGPFAFACHAPGHYEAGMRGTITVVG